MDSGKIVKFSNILIQPPPLKLNLIKGFGNTLINVFERVNFETYFLDFHPKKINGQLHQIYKNIQKGFNDSQHYELALHYFHFNVKNFELNYNFHNNGDSFYAKHFQYDSYDWKAIHFRTLYNPILKDPIESTFAQLTAKYKIKNQDNEEEVKYMIFQRSLGENLTFHSWRILVVDYQEDYFTY
jgi:hypothetical protein